MKKNIFETTYAQMQELKKAYEAAGDEAGKEKARAGHHALMEGIEGLGAAAPAASGGSTRPPGRTGTTALTSARWSGRRMWKALSPA